MQLCNFEFGPCESSQADTTSKDVESLFRLSEIRSMSTKLCPLVGWGILYMDHLKDHSLCLVLDFQGQCSFLEFYNITFEVRHTVFAFEKSLTPSNLTFLSSMIIFLTPITTTTTTTTTTTPTENPPWSSFPKAATQPILLSHLARRLVDEAHAKSEAGLGWIARHWTAKVGIRVSLLKNQWLGGLQ